eukprot:1356812-Karenia_brevis.AAC.1
MRVRNNRWESLTDDDDDEDDDECDDTQYPPLVSSSDEEMKETPSIEELRKMKLVTRRKSRFDRSKES